MTSKEKNIPVSLRLRRVVSGAAIYSAAPLMLYAVFLLGYQTILWLRYGDWLPLPATYLIESPVIPQKVALSQDESDKALLDASMDFIGVDPLTGNLYLKGDCQSKEKASHPSAPFEETEQNLQSFSQDQRDRLISWHKALDQLYLADLEKLSRPKAKETPPPHETDSEKRKKQHLEELLRVLPTLGARGGWLSAPHSWIGIHKIVSTSLKAVSVPFCAFMISLVLAYIGGSTIGSEDKA